MLMIFFFINIVIKTCFKFYIFLIYKKKFSLRGIMKLNSENETKKILNQMNFKEVATIFKWGQFTGHLCIK